MSTFGEKTEVAEAAGIWCDAGCSVIPIRADGTKKPAFKWNDYIKNAASSETVAAWWHDSPHRGIGIVCGQASGNLEMLELEGRAVTGDNLTKIFEECELRGCRHVYEMLVGDGYAEWTPSGGLHFLYRISDHEVPGNTKIARRLATAEELEANPGDRIKCLAETRGEGGYVIVAPTGGTVHPTGDRWSVTAGAIGEIPTITWEERQKLVSAIHAALDEMPPEPVIQRPKLSTLTAVGDRPGDDFNIRATWEEILEPHGWRILKRSIAETFWVRPGKKKADGHSATTGFAGSGKEDRLFVWSSSTVFDTEKPYSKFAAYALLEHNGDLSAAARELGRKGFGTQRSQPTAVSSYVAGTLPTPAVESAVVPMRVSQEPQDAEVAVRPAASVVPWKSDWNQPFVAADAFRCEEFTNLGAANVYAETFEDTFKYSAESKKWYFWNGRIWGEDKKERFEAGVKYLLAHARIQAKQAAAADDEYAKELTSWVTRMSRAQSPNIARWARSDPRITVAPEEFDENRYLITTTNGVYDLGTNTFQDTHDPKMLLSKQIKVTYDKDATAPRWDKFLTQVLPDPAVRDYVQRAIGHTLLGDAEQRALFLCHGESGSGKSQFVKVMELLFGDYAETAQPNTFNAASKSATITNDLNDLRGKRFVSVSELDEGERLNESLVKRLTGGDTAKSRGLYQENKQWRVEFALWMATNHLPRLNSDDNAMWRRVKPIHFPTVAADNGGEILRLGEKLFAEEASGILNWVLEGVRKYQEHGLQDLEQITTAVETYRREVDVVAQFLEAAVEDGSLATGEQASIPARNLHAMYRDWSQRNGHRYPLGEWRFGLRVQALGYERRKTKAANLWIGLTSGSHGLLGTMTLRE